MLTHNSFQNQTSKIGSTLGRVRTWYGLVICVLAIFGIRLFYLQVIRHDFYKKAALAGQLKEYQIPAERGILEAHDGEALIPLALNERRYTLFADPKFIKDPAKVAGDVQKILGGSANDYESKMKASSRYAVLAKKLPKDQKQRLDKLNVKGLGTRDEIVRIYPQGDLAAQVLGFVNDEGEGKYGVEQALDKDLKGTNGYLKAITDAGGVPLVANRDNIISEAHAGKKTVLSLDISMQRQLEDILKSGLEKSRSGSGSALILDPNTGQVKAMANYPTYNPAEFYKVDDASVFNNAAVSSPLEVGSIMKPLTAAAALDLGVVKKDTTYYDPSRFNIDDATVTNIEEDGGAGTRSVADILQLSLNTGATWLLMQMGDGHINQKARDSWHNFMVEHYRLSKPTGIEQGYEAEGTVPSPKNESGINIQYANTAFGQGMMATPLQMGAALAAVINGGTYYKPTLLDQQAGDDGKLHKLGPKVVRSNVVSGQVSQSMVELMQHVVDKNYATYSMSKPSPNYMIGGKTGTAEITKPGGGYYSDRFNGTFMGFVGGNKPQYVIVVRVNEPKIGGYAGSKAAAPIFGSLSSMLINNFGVTPRQ